jgi:mRNA-degrading endonuclease toxin of MazEF toxin-antitoxin module
MPRPQRGDIYRIHIPTDHRVGREFCGSHLHLVVSTDSINKFSDVIMVVPLTSPLNDAGIRKDQGDFAQFRISIRDSHKKWDDPQCTDCRGESLALTDHAFSMSVQRINCDRVASVNDDALAQVEAGLKYVFKMTIQKTTGGGLRPPMKGITTPPK